MLRVCLSEETFLVRSWRGSIGSSDVSPPPPRDSDRHLPPHSCNELIIVLGLHTCTKDTGIVHEFFLFVTLSVDFSLCLNPTFVQFSNVRISAFIYKHKYLQERWLVLPCVSCQIKACFSVSNVWLKKPWMIPWSKSRFKQMVRHGVLQQGPPKRVCFLLKGRKRRTREKHFTEQMGSSFVCPAKHWGYRLVFGDS